MKHLVEVEHWATENRREGSGRAYIRWTCSCGRIGPALTTLIHRNYRRARNGGARHVAAMEKR